MMHIYSKQHRQKGFSLIELMIVVAIMGILSAIAIPSYVEQVRKGKRADAKVELLRIAQMQESYFVQNMSYAKDLTTGAGGLGMGSSVKSEQNEYRITMTKLPGSCNGTGGSSCSGFTLIATPETGGSQSHDTECTRFTLSNTGAKGTSLGATAAAIKKCWK